MLHIRESCCGRRGEVPASASGRAHPEHAKTKLSGVKLRLGLAITTRVGVDKDRTHYSST